MELLQDLESPQAVQGVPKLISITFKRCRLLHIDPKVWGMSVCHTVILMADTMHKKARI